MIPVTGAATLIEGTVRFSKVSGVPRVLTATSPVETPPYVACTVASRSSVNPQNLKKPEESVLACSSCGVWMTPVCLLTTMSTHDSATATAVTGMSLSASSTLPTTTAGCVSVTAVPQ